MKKYKRFTGKSRTKRGSIPPEMRKAIYARDSGTCQFCGAYGEGVELTIDHLVPVAKGGLDDITNYVTACRDCNEKKADKSLDEFAKTIHIAVSDLPVHGDPIIDNIYLPLEIRMVRKHIFDRVRAGSISLTGKSAQNKLERQYRREFWGTAIGKKLEQEFPTLPGHVRVMIPEIKTIAKTLAEFLLLIELAKSASTRNLIGTVIDSQVDVVAKVSQLAERNLDAALEKRIKHALSRFEKKCREYSIE